MNTSDRQYNGPENTVYEIHSPIGVTRVKGLAEASQVACEFAATFGTTITVVNTADGRIYEF